MERNPARTASLTDSADCAWQLSQTPDSRACSPAACASSPAVLGHLRSARYEDVVVAEQELHAVEALGGVLDDVLTAGVGALPVGDEMPVGAQRVVVPLGAGGPQPGPADGPGPDLVAQDHLDRHRQQRARRVGGGEARVEHDRRVALGAGEFRLHALDVMEEAHVERRVERGVDVTHGRREREVRVRFDQPRHDRAPGDVHDPTRPVVVAPAGADLDDAVAVDDHLSRVPGRCRSRRTPPRR